MHSGLDLEIDMEMAMEKVLELEFEMASGVQSENKLFRHIGLKEIHNTWLAPLLLFYCYVFETDVIAVLEQCWANWKYSYHCAKDYDLSRLFWG